MVDVQASQANVQIDLSRSIPPFVPMLDEAVRRALATLSGSVCARDLIEKTHPRGSLDSRTRGARLLAGRLGRMVDPAQLALVNGAQNAFLILFSQLVGKGGVLLAEALSYAPLKALAHMANVRLMSVALDREGIIPEAFEQACQKVKPSALYCNPSIHNPTTAVSPPWRRRDLASIARKYGVQIIEDDALGLLHPECPPPISTLAPDVTWYVMTFTKCLAHGTRLAYVVAPSPRAANALFASFDPLSFWHCSPLTTGVVEELIESGAAQAIAASIARESTEREQLAREILRDIPFWSQPGAMHIWLPLPPVWHRSQFVRAAAEEGVAIRAADVFAVDGAEPPNAVRLSLSAASDQRAVEDGLHRIRRLLHSTPA